MIVLQDDSLPTNDGVTCWVPYKLKNQINFGRDSIITIIGQTSIGKGYDRVKKVQTDEERIMLNTFSIFGIPELLTIVDEPGELL